MLSLHWFVCVFAIWSPFSPAHRLPTFCCFIMMYFYPIKWDIAQVRLPIVKWKLQEWIQKNSWLCKFFSQNNIYHLRLLIWYLIYFIFYFLDLFTLHKLFLSLQSYYYSLDKWFTWLDNFLIGPTWNLTSPKFLIK